MANRWSHAHGKTSPEVVPFTWQPTFSPPSAPVRLLARKARSQCPATACTSMVAEGLDNTQLPF
jgi:hypothetical protein